MVKAKKFIFQKQFDGFPKETDLKLVEEELPPIKDGEFLAEAVYLSLDPYMRILAPRLQLGTTFIGRQVAKIIESKNSNFPEGRYVVGNFGWRTHTISDGKLPTVPSSDIFLAPDAKGLPLSLFLGVLGRTGNTAYFGFLEICKPKPGETVVVTSAAGAVGSQVGQIAKIIGCNVIGVTGSEDKGRRLVEQLQFDHFLNYNDKEFERKLEQITPKGVDIYFDNVGGETSSIIIRRMNLFGRISVCGAISGYNATTAPTATTVQPSMVRNQLKMQGFVIARWDDRFMDGILQNQEWVKEGKLKYRETITEGFENMPKAFLDMLNGKNFGKAVVKV